MVEEVDIVIMMNTFRGMGKIIPKEEAGSHFKIMLFFHPNFRRQNKFNVVFFFSIKL
jgi:hypothetical protein